MTRKRPVTETRARPGRLPGGCLKRSHGREFSHDLVCTYERAEVVKITRKNNRLVIVRAERFRIFAVCQSRKRTSAARLRTRRQTRSLRSHLPSGRVLPETGRRQYATVRRVEPTTRDVH